MSDFVLNKLESLERRVAQLEAHSHEPGYHEHLMDEEEHAAHHARLDKPKENRQTERRAGGERRQSTEKYEGEERRDG